MKCSPRIPVLLVTALALALVQAQNEDAPDDDVVPESNAIAACDYSENALAGIGATRTCIESPEFDGKRCFFTYVPDCAGEDSPLVYDLHGLGSCPTFSAFYTGWRELADEHCFVVIYPLGTIDATKADFTCWGVPGGLLYNDGNEFARSCCCSKGILPVPINDGAFLRQVAAVSVRDIAEATSGKTTIDTKRIYMGGHSNGCIASISMAARHSDMVAAVGCHAGTALTQFPETYSPTPMAFVHGTEDKVVKYAGGYFAPDAQEYLAVISKTNGCTESTSITTEGYLGTSNKVTEFRSSECTNGADVVLYALEGVGHNPYLIASRDPSFGIVDKVRTEFDTTQLMWDFVSKYSLQIEPELVPTVVSDSMAPSEPPSTMPTISPSTRAPVGNALFGLLIVSLL